VNNNSNDENGGNQNDTDDRRNFLTQASKTAFGILAVPIIAGETYARTGRLSTNVNFCTTDPVFSLVDVEDGGYGRWNDFDSAAPATTTGTKKTANGGKVVEITRDVTFVFHGAGGTDSYTDELMDALRRSSSATAAAVASSSIGRMVRWDADSSDLLRASIRGENIGKDVARVFAEEVVMMEDRGVDNDGDGGTTTITKVRTRVHAIGISVGAFAANSLVKELDRYRNGQGKDSKTQRRLSLPEGEKIEIQLTLLDPFEQKAVVGIGYGARNFGRGADYAQQYYNTDDPVPSTGSPLPRCAAVDVTSIRPSEVFGHDWPLVYYSRYVLKGKGKDNKDNSNGGFVPSSKRRDVGTVLVV